MTRTEALEAVAEAARALYDRCAKAEDDGYRSRERQYAINMLKPFLAALDAASDEWRAITDAQKDGTEYLIGWFELPRQYHIEAAFWHSTHGAWCSRTQLFTKDPGWQPTHYRPLPAPPRETEE